MRKLAFVLFMMVFTGVFAGTPEGFKYQAVVRDASGDVLAGQDVSIRISILQGSETGPSVYTEEHSVQTNAFGLVNLTIGEGTGNSGDFSLIDWSNDDHFLSVEIDASGGSDYMLMGTSRLMSVPYALHAQTAENVFSGDYNDLENTPDFSGWDSNAADDFDGDYNSLENTPDLAGFLTTEETSGWDMNAGDDFSGDYNDLSNQPSIPTDVSELNNDAGYLTEEVDGSVTNEIQVLSISNDTIYLSDGGFVKLPPPSVVDYEDVSNTPDLTDTSNWNEAFEWGNHTEAGYLTEFTETDPEFNNHLASDITAFDTAQWRDAYEWGNHAEAGYLTYYIEADPVFDAHVAKDITENDTIAWNEAYSWGDHNDAGYLTETSVLQDADGDTKIQVEESANEDIIRFDIAGNEAMKFDGKRLAFTDNGSNIFIGSSAGFNTTSGGSNTFLGHSSGLYNTDAGHNTYIGASAGKNNDGDGNTNIGNAAGYGELSTSTYNYNTMIGNYSGYKMTTGTKSVFIGYRSGYFTSTGTYNTFIGSDAAYYNETGGSNTIIGYQAAYGQSGGSHSNNTMLGMQSGFNIIDGTYNLYLGTHTGYYNENGSSNVVLGYKAGFGSNGFSYSQNVFVGSEAGALVDNGSENAAIGYRSGYSLSSGYGNAFFGSRSGYAATDAQANTYIGREAGRYNASGDGNTLIGYQSGYGVDGSSAGFNTMLGYQSGKLVGDGTQNVYIGSESGKNNESGSYNTTLGYHAGRGIAANSYSSNTLIGYYVGNAITTGSHNTVVGGQSGVDLTEGNENTIIGKQSGYNLTTGSGNVLLGFKSGYTLTTESNKLFIDNSPTEAPLIYGEFDNNNLRVNGDFEVSENITIEGTPTEDNHAVNKAYVDSITPSKSISLNTYNAELGNNASRVTYGVISLPENGIGSIAYNFVLPQDYTPGTDITIRFIAYSDATGDVYFRNNFVVVQGPVTDYFATSLNFDPVVTTFSAANDYIEISATINDASDTIKPGDAISWGAFRNSDDALDTSTGTLYISGIEVLYE